MCVTHIYKSMRINFGGSAMNRNSINRWAGTAVLCVLPYFLTACGGGQSGGVEANNNSSLAEPASSKTTSASSTNSTSNGTTQRHPNEVEAAVAYARAYSPLATSALVIAQPSAARFLSQASFGATDEEVAKVQTLWRQGWLQQQFAMPQGASHFDRVLAAQVSWAAQEPGRDIRKAPASIPDSTIWQSYITDPDQLRKRVGYSLSQLLVTSLEGFSSGTSGNGLLAAAYLDVLEKNAFGNYRNLLKEVTLNPAMGYYLSMKGNQRANASTGRVPDENYAREIMQLFTIGLVELQDNGLPKTTTNDPSAQTIPTYDLNDVTQMARVFTGWDWNYKVGASERYRTPMVLNASLSSPEDVRVFCKDPSSPAGCKIYSMGNGGSPEARLEWALDVLFNHPNVGPFIGKQLIQRLVTSNPSTDYVARVAAKFNNNGAGVRGDMKAVIEAILLDREALMNEVNPPQDWGKLREPVLRLTQLARHLRMQSSADLWPIGNESDPAYGLGQSPMRAPSVFNFYRPGYVAPRTPLSAAGKVAPEFQITTETSVPGYVNRVHRFMQTPGEGTQLDYSRDMALADDPARLVDHLNNYFAHRNMSPATVSRITAAISAIKPAGQPGGSSGDYRLHRVQTALLLTLASPQTIVLK
jgi:uncharacterized protein (DUF1800 family)